MLKKIGNSNLLKGRLAHCPKRVFRDILGQKRQKDSPPNSGVVGF